MNTNTIDPTTFLCILWWFVCVVIFIICKINQTEKELKKYMDDKIDEYINELKNRKL